MLFYSNKNYSFIPDFVEIQRKSFLYFLEKGVIAELEKKNPITTLAKDFDLSFYPQFFQLHPPDWSPKDSILKAKTYACRLYVPAQLLNNLTKEVKLQWVLIGNLPLMTKRGHFIINGSPRVIVNQMIRSPGIYYQELIDKKKRRRYYADLISYRGTWLRLEIDKKKRIWAKMKKIPKISILLFLQSMGFTQEVIFQSFQYSEFLKKSFLEGIHPISTQQALISFYLKTHPKKDKTEIYPEMAQKFLFRKFMNPRTYDLGKIGRIQLNKKLGLSIPLTICTLTPQDVLFATHYLVKLEHGLGSLDDIDHLKNRRVRASGELIQGQFATGLIRLEKMIREKLKKPDGTLSIRSLLTTKPINGALREFFGSSQLSQFMDQTNPLAEITHKRRLSSLGPGGISRETAGMAVRGIHPSHYGRICPIETPEGPNAGLVNSITTYTKLNSEGFLETPFFKLFDGQVQKNRGPLFFSALNEENVNIAPGDLKINFLNFLPNTLIPIRNSQEFQKVFRTEVKYVGISSIQMISVATSLIPFLEHDDANRALMGSNMQRQAVPLLIPENPLIGTGLEARVISDSGHGLQATKSGIISYASANQIRIHTFFPNSLNNSLYQSSFYFLCEANQIKEKPLFEKCKNKKKREQIFKNSGFFASHASHQVKKNQSKRIEIHLEPFYIFSCFMLLSPFKGKKQTPKKGGYKFSNFCLCSKSKGQRLIKTFNQKLIKTFNFYFCFMSFLSFPSGGRTGRTNHTEATVKYMKNHKLSKTDSVFLQLSEKEVKKWERKLNMTSIKKNVPVGPAILFFKYTFKTVLPKKKYYSSIILSNENQAFILNTFFLNVLKKKKINILKKDKTKQDFAINQKLDKSDDIFMPKSENKKINSQSEFYPFSTFFSFPKNLVLSSLGKDSTKKKRENAISKKKSIPFLGQQLFKREGFSTVEKLISRKKNKKTFLYQKFFKLKKIDIKKTSKNSNFFFHREKKLQNLFEIKKNSNRMQFQLVKIFFLFHFFKLNIAQNPIRDFFAIQWDEKKKIDFRLFFSYYFFQLSKLTQSYFLEKNKFFNFYLKKNFSNTKTAPLFSYLKQHDDRQFFKKITKKGLAPFASHKESVMLYAEQNPQKGKKQNPFPLKGLGPKESSRDKGENPRFSSFGHKYKIMCSNRDYKNFNKNNQKIFILPISSLGFPIFHAKQNILTTKGEKNTNSICFDQSLKNKTFVSSNHLFLMQSKKEQKNPKNKRVFSLINKKNELFKSSLTSKLKTYQRTNQDTCLNQRPLVFEGDWVQKGDLIAEGSASVGGDLSLGKTILVAYMPWEGYNFEDALLISERLLFDDVYTSLHIERYEVEIRDTKFGIEQITKEIPDIHFSKLFSLNSTGVIKIGTWVKEGDILVGKITPTEKKPLSPHEKLLYDIVEKNIPITRDTSLRVPKNIEGRVVDIQFLDTENIPSEIFF